MLILDNKERLKSLTSVFILRKLEKEKQKYAQNKKKEGKNKDRGIKTGWGRIKENIKCYKNVLFILKAVRRRREVTV